jgi:hypothetical protein
LVCALYKCLLLLLLLLLIDSNSSASSQHPQTLRFFPREVKNIKHDQDIFLKASRGQILTKTIRTREQHVELTAAQGGVS